MNPLNIVRISDMEPTTRLIGGSGYALANPGSLTLAFGASVALLGSLNAVNFDSQLVLAIGDPGQSNDLGAVVLFFLSEDNATVFGERTISFADLPGSVNETLTPRFGSSIVLLGDIDQDGIVEVAFGLPGLFADNERSNVVILSLLLTAGPELLPTIVGMPLVLRPQSQNGARFGASLAFLGLFGDAVGLAVGNPLNDIGSGSDRGAVSIFFVRQGPSGLFETPEITISQSHIPFDLQVGGKMGTSMAAIDVPVFSGMQLLVGVPGTGAGFALILNLQICGDGIISGIEECDTGSMVMEISSPGCTQHCTIIDSYFCENGTLPSVCALCGDGQTSTPETCDDGARVNGDGCSSTCQQELGWLCSGAVNAESVCNEVCGDGLVVGQEQCDDGNSNNNDGCSSLCTVEIGYSCFYNGISQCDRCGNNQIGLAEDCDDGNTRGGDGCNSQCLQELGWTCDQAPSLCFSVCGDGLVVGQEQCDDGDNLNGNGCSQVCFVEECGNGIQDPNENCDDQNTESGDGCNSECQIESSFTCSGFPSECRRQSSNAATTTVIAVVVVVSLCCLIFLAVCVGIAFWSQRKRTNLRETAINIGIPILEGPYENLRKIGEGQGGDVFVGDYQGAQFALKALKASSSQAVSEDFQQECEMLNQLQHPNIVRFWGIYLPEDEKSQFMVLEFMECGALSKYLQSPDRLFSPEDMFYLTYGVALGMLALEKKHFVHRDLACRNLLVNHLLNVKISDFGLTRKLGETGIHPEEKRPVPVRWTAPEVFDAKIFVQKSDVWSFAVTCWEIFSRAAVPWGGLTNSQIPPAIKEGALLQKPNNMPERLYTILKGCWKLNYQDRPSFSKVVVSLRQLAQKKQYKFATSFKDEELSDLEQDDIYQAPTQVSQLATVSGKKDVTDELSSPFFSAALPPPLLDNLYNRSNSSSSNSTGEMIIVESEYNNNPAKDANEKQKKIPKQIKKSHNDRKTHSDNHNELGGNYQN